VKQEQQCGRTITNETRDSDVKTENSNETRKGGMKQEGEQCETRRDSKCETRTQ
jgi:hypothetical protein